MWLAYEQDIIYRDLKKKKVAKMIIEFGISRSTISYKIAIVELIIQYKIKKSPVILYFLKKHVKVIQEICKENASELIRNKNLRKSY